MVLFDKLTEVLFLDPVERIVIFYLFGKLCRNLGLFFVKRRFLGFRTHKLSGEKVMWDGLVWTNLAIALLIGADSPGLSDTYQVEGVFDEVSLNLEIKRAIEGKGRT